MSNKYKYSEIFTSIQGEGKYTGVPTIWLRWFLCNLQCSGFGQKSPEERSTHILPYKEFDVSKIKRIQDLPVWEYGCDSSYSWSKKFKHLCPELSASQITDSLEDELRKLDNNPDGKFVVGKPGSWDEEKGSIESSQRDIHLCMTGGEPMIERTQYGMIELLQEFEKRSNLPYHVTVETNGTQPITDELAQMICSYNYKLTEWFWSVSPKLLYTSGEKPAKAIKPHVVREYQTVSRHGQLKFVVSNRPEAWDELERTVDLFREAGVKFPVWIMPVGATQEQQSDADMRAVVEETIRRGYNVSARVHAYIWGNQIGT